jgi:inosose dehydratase
MIERHNCPTRRAVLQSGAAALLGLTALPKLFAAEDKKNDAFGGFTLGAQTYTFRHFDLEPALKKIKELGLTHAEFYQKHIPLEATPEQLQAILKLCKEYDVKPVCYGVQSFTKDHDKNKKAFEFGKALGIKAFSANPDPDSFDSLDKLCDEYKIAIGIHPHGPSGPKGKETLDRWYSAEVIMKGVKDHHKLIGSCLDTGHLIRAAQLGKKLDPAQEIRTMGERNFGIHLKDHDNEKRTDVVFGKAMLDVPGVLKALREVKFAYAISIEYEAKEDNPSDDMKECVQVFKESVKKIG